MKLKFSDSRINEFYEGGKLFVNDGKPFEVSNAVGVELLKAFHVIEEDSPVPVFTEVSPAEIAEAKETTKDTKESKK